MRLVIVLALVFGVGSCVGARSGETKVEFIEVPRTKVVTAPAPEPETVSVVPESCLSVLEYARDIATAAEANYRLSDKQLDILSQARLLLAKGENTSAAELRQRDLMGDTVANLSDLEQAFFYYEKFDAECEAALD